MKQLYASKFKLWTLAFVLGFGPWAGQAQTQLFDDAVSSGTIWHSNGSEVSNPMADRNNSSSNVIQNNGASSWEETQIFPDTYTIQTGDKLFISFYNPNGVTSWQLKMSLSTDGADKYIGDYNHEAPAANGWYESVIDISGYAGQDITKITIYPAGGEAKSIYYDALYFGKHSQSGATNLFRENGVLGLWNSDGGLVANPQKDAINYSDQVIVNNGSGGWKDTQWFPNYVIQANDRFYISFHNPNNAAAWQLRMDLSATGSFSWIGEPAHDSNAASGWVEVSLDLSAYSSETITKIQLYSAAGEGIQIYFDNIYFSSSSHQANYWTGTSSTDWSVSGNWEGNYVPTTLSNVTIEANTNKPQINADVTINHLNLQDDVTLTSGTLTVNGNIDGSSGNIIANSGSSLITKGTISGTNHQIKRTTTFSQSTGKYSAVGSPVAGASTSSLGALVYAYDETVAYGVNGNARFTEVTSAVNMAPGDAYFSAFTGEITFTGTPNTGNVDVALTYNETNDGGAANAGFNLVANPYPCAIDHAALVSGNADINGAIYLWDDGGSDLTRRENSDYITVNNLGVAGGGSSRSGDWNGHIGTAQGFFVKANKAGTLTFTNDLKASGNNADANYFRKSDEARQTVKISIEGNEQRFESLIGFVADATVGIDRLYDAPLFGTNSLYLTSLINNQPYTIQGLPELTNDISIPLSLSIAEAGEYAISISEVEGNVNQNIYLHDQVLGKTVLLEKGKTYQFNSVGEQSNSRFSLTITSSILGTQTNLLNGYQLKWDLNHLQIISDEPSKTSGVVEIANLSGKSLLKQNLLWNSREINVDFSFRKNTIYLIRIMNGDHIHSQKIMIR